MCCVRTYARAVSGLPDDFESITRHDLMVVLHEGGHEGGEVARLLLRKEVAANEVYARQVADRAALNEKKARGRGRGWANERTPYVCVGGWGVARRSCVCGAVAV